MSDSQQYQAGLGFSGLQDLYQEEKDSDDEIDDVETMSVIRMYSKLPPPHVPSIPFTFFQENPQFDITTEEDFQNLKNYVLQYITNIDEKMFAAFSFEPKDVTSTARGTTSPEEEEGEGEETEITTEEQPTTIQLLKVLDKANKIVKEVDRSHYITQLKRARSSRASQ